MRYGKGNMIWNIFYTVRRHILRAIAVSKQLKYHDMGKKTTMFNNALKDRSVTIGSMFQGGKL